MQWGSGLVKNFLHGLFGGNQGSEARSFHRYDIGNPRIASALLPRGIKTMLMDLSYGGVGLRLRDEAHVSWRDIPKSSAIRLELFGQGIELAATRVYNVGSVAGYRFHHKDPEGLIWLRVVLENLQRGAGLKVARGGDLDDRFVSGDWTVLQGDDATEMRVRRGKTGGLSDVEVTFEEGNRCCVFSWREGSMTTGIRSLGNEVGDRGINTGRIDKPLLRQVAAIMVGLGDVRVKKLCEPILDAALKELAAS